MLMIDHDTPATMNNAWKDDPKLKDKPFEILDLIMVKAKGDNYIPRSRCVCRRNNITGEWEVKYLD